MKKTLAVLFCLMFVAGSVYAGASSRPGKAPAWVVGNDCAAMLELDAPYWTCRWSTSEKCNWSDQDKAQYDQCLAENL